MSLLYWFLFLIKGVSAQGKVISWDMTISLSYLERELRQ